MPIDLLDAQFHVLWQIFVLHRLHHLGHISVVGFLGFTPFITRELSSLNQVSVLAYILLFGVTAVEFDKELVDCVSLVVFHHLFGQVSVHLDVV